MESNHLGSVRDAPPRGERPADRRTLQSEDVHIRNYDPYREYDLALTVTAPDGSVAFEDVYYLQPGQIESVRDRLPTGEYRVTAELDNRHSKSATTRVGPTPAETIHVELGNGIASVTEGLYG